MTDNEPQVPEEANEAEPQQSDKQAEMEAMQLNELWRKRIERRETALVERSQREHWERYVREFRGDYSEILGDVDQNRVIPLNLVYAYVRAAVPTLYIQDPYFEFTPKQRTSVGAAKLKEIAVNDIWGRKKFKRQIKKVIRDNKLIGHGWIKVGYKANIGIIEEADKKREFVEYEDFFLYRVNWKHIIFNDESVDPPHDSRWIAHKFYVPLKDVKNNESYAPTRADINGVHLAGNLEEGDQKNTSNFTTSDVEYAELWEAWDKDTDKKLIVSKQVGVLQSIKWPYTAMDGFPFLFLCLAEDNDDPYGISDVSMGEKHVLEKTKLRTAFLNHIKRGNRQLMTPAENFSQESKDAYERGDDSALLEVSDPDKVKPLPYAAFQSDVYGLESRLDDDLSQIWAQKPSDRAGQARTQTRTKFELEKQDYGTSTRIPTSKVWFRIS
jgi:hypothetical protein